MKKKYILLVLIEAVTAFYMYCIIKKEMLKRASTKFLSDKHLTLMNLLNQWMKMNQNGKEIKEYFITRGMYNIAIYGMGCIGERLYDELCDSEINVKYIIDKNANRMYKGVDIIPPNRKIEDVDAVVVTPVFYYDEIKICLEDITEGEIISLDDIIYEMIC